MVAQATILTARLSVKLVILTIVVTELLLVVHMVAQATTPTALLSANLVILTTVVTKRPLVFHLTQLAHLITLIVPLNVPLGVVTPVIQSQEIAVYL